MENDKYDKSMDEVEKMKEIIFSRARRVEKSFLEEKSENNIHMWNEYKVLLHRLDLLDEYEVLYE